MSDRQMYDRPEGRDMVAGVMFILLIVISLFIVAGILLGF